MCSVIEFVKENPYVFSWRYMCDYLQNRGLAIAVETNERNYFRGKVWTGPKARDSKDFTVSWENLDEIWIVFYDLDPADKTDAHIIDMLKANLYDADLPENETDLRSKRLSFKVSLDSFC